MGMTKAKRYANHKGGRKYEKSEREIVIEARRDGGKPGKRVELPKSEGHEGREDKLRASEIFKEVWRRCQVNEGYLGLKDDFLKKAEGMG